MRIASSVLFVGAVALAAAASVDAAETAARPNILWIIAEDMGPDLAYYGDRDARTPNLDRLASEGRRYNNAYATAPICSASRSAFNTGMYQTSIGAHHHRSHRDDNYPLPVGVRLISQRLHDAGYITANLHTLPASLDFDGKNKTDWNFHVADKAFDSGQWSVIVKRQPFYAQINLGEAHRPYPKSASNPTNPATVTLPPYLPDAPIAREDFARYHDSIAIVDAKVGAILDLLDREGVRENTLVFFFGDNGRECFRGKYFAYEQGTHVPLIVRWPGHVAPGSSSDGLVSLIDVAAESLVAAGVPLPSNLQGQPFLSPEAKKREYLVTARDRIDDTPDRVRTIRDARYKYIRNYQPERPYLQRMLYAEATNPNVNLMRDLMAKGKLNAAQAKFMASQRPVEELYDLQADPFELNDLARSPEANEPVERLRAALARWENETGDQGVTLEDPATEARIIAEHDRKMAEQFNADGSKKKRPKK